MQNFWYNSPVRFTTIQDDFNDVLNPQNIQFYGKHQPYQLEKGELHRYLIPNSSIFQLQGTDAKLYIESGNKYLEVPCEFSFRDDNYLNYITFKFDEDIIGQLVIEVDNEKVLISNCIHFTNTEIDGVKQLRVVTKHAFNRQLFDYTDEHAYFVTNIPAYEFGNYYVDADIINQRNGGNATLKIQETFLDEVVRYNFNFKGDGDISTFVSSICTNTDLFINGTKRTLKEKLEIDEVGFLTSGTFVSEKDETGNNLTIDEFNVFEDLELFAINFTPNGSSIIKNGTDLQISVEFNTNIKLNSGNVRIYKDNVLFKTKSANQLSVNGNILFLNENISSYGNAVYRLELDSSLVSSYIGLKNNFTLWSFSVSALGEFANISWLNGEINNIVGDFQVVPIKTKNIYYGTPLYWQVKSGSSFIDYQEYNEGINISMPLVNGINQFRLRGSYNSENIYSNVLQYTREQALTPNLISVTKINSNIVKYKWNNSQDILSTSITFQYSIDQINWVNIGNSTTIGNLDNELEISSTSLLSITSGTPVYFRIKYSETVYTNVYSFLWVINGIITQSGLNIKNGITTININVLNNPFIGYCIVGVNKGSNVKRMNAVVDQFGVDTGNASENRSVYSVINIPIGYYTLTLNTDVSANNVNLSADATSFAHLSTTTEISDSVVSISGYKTID